MPVSQTVDSGDILLEMPADEDSMLIARLAVSGVLARGPFDVDTIEDIKTAVGEACFLISNRQASHGRLRVIFSRGGVFRVRVFRDGGFTGQLEGKPPDSGVCAQVLGTMMRDVNIQTDGREIIAIEMSMPIP